MSLNTTPRTWVAGEVVTAAELNTEVRDALAGLQAAWPSYTPAWTGAGGNPAIGNGTQVWKYTRIGKERVRGRIQITMGSTTTFGSGNWIFGLPVAAHADYTINMQVGQATGLDSSVPTFNFPTAVLVTSTTFFLPVSGAAGFTGTSPWTWATGDKLSIDFDYEPA